MSAPTFDAVIVGGGFYGARLALQLRSTGRTVLLVEREPGLLGRASLRNQARVHNGYHYPRSLLTSLRSRLNYSRFLDEFSDCVDRSFPHYYAVGRAMSKITAAQFAEFCRRIGAPASVAPAAVRRLFNDTRIDSVFEVQECAFDAVKLRGRVAGELVDAGVDVRCETEAQRLSSVGDGRRARVMLEGRDGEYEVETDLVLNCTYSRLNRLLAESGAGVIPAKHEVTEMALVEPPRELGGAAVTVMDGPFFSMMPYPSRGLFTLSHVRYTPHASWHDVAGEPVADGSLELPSGKGAKSRSLAALGMTKRGLGMTKRGLGTTDGELGMTERSSRFTHMVRDAERYLPVMRGCRYVDSLWEVKTVMPRSEQDDSRPILLRRSDRFPCCLTVLGAKIDSVYDVEAALAAELGLPRTPTPISVPAVVA